MGCFAGRNERAVETRSVCNIDFRGRWEKGIAKRDGILYNGTQERGAGLETQHTGGTIMEKYVCGPCGYEYDPAVGDPDNGIAPGTAFADLPEDWVCPICGVGKDEFEPA